MVKITAWAVCGESRTYGS